MKEITVFIKITDIRKILYIDLDYLYIYQNYEMENKCMHVGIPPHVNQNTVFYHRL